MKVLIIGPFPNPITGQSIANETVYRGLEEKGYEMDFIDTNFSKELTDKKRQGKFELNKILTVLKKSLGECKRIVFTKNDVIYMTPGASYLGIMRFAHYILLCIITGKKYYLHIHNGAFKKIHDSQKGLKRFFLEYLIKKSTGIIVLGESLKSMFQEVILEDKILVCENGVQNEFIASEEEIKEKLEKYGKDSKKRVLYLSNLMEEKGILDLLRTSEKFSDEEIEFNLAGAIEPSLEKKIKEYIEKYPKKIKYHGIVRGEQKKKLLLENYIFILPSYDEGQPISILEAYMNGCSVITDKNIGGIKDIFENSLNGISCESGNHMSIYDSIKNIDEEKYIQKNYELGKNKFSKKIFIENIEKLIIQN